MSHKILCTTDGTDHSTRAVELASEMASKLGPELTICSVNVALGGGRGPMIYTKDDGDVETVIANAAKIAAKSGVSKVHTVFLRGREAAASIVTYAEQGNYDIIVTGTGDKHGVSRLVLGSVAADVASRAHCTVVVAR